MDSRLFNIPLRPGTPRQQDLPLIARAIVALYQGQAKLKTGRVKNLGYVRIEAKDFQVQLLASDWAKVLPYIQSEDFDQVVTKAQLDSVRLDPNFVSDSSLIDHQNQQYYLKVLYTLRGLFPDRYPTSNE